MFLTYGISIGIFYRPNKTIIEMYNRRTILNGSNPMKSSMNRGYNLSIQKLEL